jgi:hypothetical protein
VTMRCMYYVNRRLTDFMAIKIELTVVECPVFPPHLRQPGAGRARQPAGGDSLRRASGQQHGSVHHRAYARPLERARQRYPRGLLDRVQDDRELILLDALVACCAHLPFVNAGRDRT